MVGAAAIYARISDDREGLALGVSRQVEDCRRLAEQRGWPVVEAYVDNDVSAWRGRSRPEYRRMLEDVKAGTVDAVVVWALDRLHRAPRELEEFFEICDAAGVTALASVSGDVDLGTHDGRFLARILGAVARKESDDKSRRITRKHEELAQAGKISGGGTRPFGFDDDRRTVREPEAVIIREVVQRILAGDGIRTLCADLDRRGVHPVQAERWHPRALHRMAMSARIAGLREHRGVIVGTAEWPAIISAEDSAKVRALLGDERRKQTREPRRYLLAGMLRCGKCGATLVSRARQDRTPRYVCAKGVGFSGCNGCMILAEPVEAWITEAVLYRLDSPQLAKALRDGDRSTEADNFARALEEDLAQLDELGSAYGAKQITMPEWLAARRPIEERIERARKRLSRMTGTNALDGFVGHSEHLRSVWNELPLSRKRAIIAAVMDHAVIGAGVRGRNRFDPERIQPAWRR
jgi:site-specific DNA recombinase